MRGFLLVVGPTANAKDSDKVVSAPATALPVLHPSAPIQLPLDELLIRAAQRSFVYLTTLDSDGKPRSLLLLEGYTPFSNKVVTALRRESFDLRYANGQVI